jgi:hypothetical protein
MRVILTSAYSQEMLTPAMNASQIRGCIRKPYELGDLSQTFERPVRLATTAGATVKIAWCVAPGHCEEHSVGMMLYCRLPFILECPITPRHA